MDTASAAAETALRRDAVLGAVAFAAQRFLEDVEWEHSVDEVLGRLGEATSVSRVSLSEVTAPGDGAILRAQWVAPGIGPPFTVGTVLAYEGLERWVNALGRGEVVHGLTDALPNAEREVLTARGVRSVLVAPISVGGTWWGSLAFDERVDHRIWTPVEIDALRAAAGTLGAAIDRGRSDRRLRETEARYRQLVEEVPAITYVDGEDPATGRWPTSYISPQVERMLGYSIDEWLRDPTLWERCVHPDDRALARAADDRHHRTGEPLRSEYRLITKDGGELWVRDEATIVTDEGGHRTSRGVLIDITESKRAEAELRAAEARFRTIVEHTPVVTYQELGEDDYDVASSIVYMSPQIERLLGYPVERWATVPGFWMTLLHPDDMERVTTESDRTARTGEPYSQEYRMISADGRTVWFRDDAVLIRDASGRPAMWQGVMVDITERKAVEEQVRAAEQRFRDLVEHIPAITYRESLDASPEEFYISPQVEALLGYTPREWTWTPDFWLDHLHPDDVGRVSAFDLAMNETGEPFSIESRFRRADGSYVWLQDQASLIPSPDGKRLWQGFLLDITERREAEAAVAAAETRYRTLVEQVPVIIYTMEIDPDDPSVSRTTYISPRQEDLLGYSIEETLETGDLWRDTVHPDDRERVFAEDVEGNATGEDFVMEYRMIAKDGRTVWMHDEARVIRDAEGRPRSWQGFMFDITERKEAEDRLGQALDVEREATQRLRALDEMKNTFLQAVSHDLRTPLAAILGLAVTLENAEIDLDADDARDLAKRIAANARKLDRMVTDLLDLDRLARGIVEPKRHPIDVGALARRVVEDSGLAARGRVTVDAPEIVANVDGAKVERILENLLANTARHTPADTRVWVRVLRTDAGVVLVVEDEGTGVPEALRETIFEPFQQGPDAPEHSPGVGVGLTLVRRFAELHGGRAWVEERPGGGASFRVYLEDAPASSAGFGSAG